MLPNTTIFWLFLAFALFCASLGVSRFLHLFLYLGSFIIGLLSILYYYGKINLSTRNIFSSSFRFSLSHSGIFKIKRYVSSNYKGFTPEAKISRVIAGTPVIDNVLNEILDFIYRDYIHTWYRRLSDDLEFQHHIRLSIQKIIISFSERAKYVDLIPYFTTRLVDDFASHIRLYKRSLEKVSEHKKDDNKPPADLVSMFFDLETDMEDIICRDDICLSEQHEKEYLKDLGEVLLFLLLPPDDFHNKPFRYIFREVLVMGIFLPTINLLSDPDYINQTISWLCRESTFNNDSFLTIVRSSFCYGELSSVCEKIDLEIMRQRSKDTGGDDGSKKERSKGKRGLSISSSPNTVIKQQLNSLMFVKELCEERMLRFVDGVYEGHSPSLKHSQKIDKLIASGQKLYSLPFDIVLNNNVALPYFIEFMTNCGAQSYLFFYLTIEGYRVSAEQQISAALLTNQNGENPDLEMLKEAATSIFNQYLSERASPRLKLDETLVENLWNQIQHNQPSDTIFNEVQTKVWDILQQDHHFPAFKRSQLYIKLLGELNLLKSSSCSAVIGDCNSLLDDYPSDDNCSQITSVDENAADSSSISSAEGSISSSAAPPLNHSESSDVLSSLCTPTLFNTNSQSYTLKCSITNTGICREHGQAYALYLISVTKKADTEKEETWNVYRRYSDFRDLHSTIQERYDSLSGLALPSKRTFNNMNKEFLEKRKTALNAYLQSLLNPSVLNSHKGLLELIHQFLELVVWEKEKGPFSKKINNVVNPFKSSVRSVGNFVKSMPDNFVDGVVKVSGGIRSIPSNMLDGVGKILNVRSDNTSAQAKPEVVDSAKVGASLISEDDDNNIPLRILLLLMDEVFDLKTRNMWLRRRMVAILRQFVKTLMGDSINKKILDYVDKHTSPDYVAGYLKKFKDSFWPNNQLAEPQSPRDRATKMCTRIVCKAKMLGTVSDEIRHLMGSEALRQGVTLVFDMLQHKTLNRRLIYVILEGFLEVLFPENKFKELFCKLHSSSSRIKLKKNIKRS